ncbi:MAG TPA: EamA family transporter, partial [Ktedonobacteraceae bacterium]|nr:EamA family transporter [Ktedonobacteraceae bacterium]
MKETYRIEQSQKTVGTDLSRSHPDTAQTKKPASNRFAILLSLLALYTIWGSTYLAMRIALDGFPPFLMAGVRFLVAAAILFPILRL